MKKKRLNAITAATEKAGRKEGKNKRKAFVLLI
jgi:hypothetical protein